MEILFPSPFRSLIRWLWVRTLDRIERNNLSKSRSCIAQRQYSCFSPYSLVFYSQNSQKILIQCIYRHVLLVESEQRLDNVYHYLASTTRKKLSQFLSRIYAIINVHFSLLFSLISHFTITLLSQKLMTWASLIRRKKGKRMKKSFQHERKFSSDQSQGESTVVIWCPSKDIICIPLNFEIFPSSSLLVVRFTHSLENL